MKKVWYRNFTLILCLGMVLTVVLAGCSKSSTSDNSEGSTSPASATGSAGSTTSAAKAGTENSTKPIDITFSVAKSAIQEENGFYEKVVDDYNKIGKKAKVKLVWVDIAAGNDTAHRTWVTTQLTGGTAPDIVISRYIWTQQDYNKGLIQSLNSYLDEPNPYNGNLKWKDTFSDSIINAMVVPTTDVIAGIPSFASAVRLYYNKKIFADAGITDLPQTFDEFKAAEQKILDKGYTPMAIGFNKQGGGQPDWMIRYLSDQTVEYEVPALDLDKNGSITSNEIVAGIDKGTIDFSKMPWSLDFEIMKEWTKYWPKGFSGMTSDEATDMFLSGKGAMILGQPSFMQKVEGVIDYGVMRVPYLTKDNHPTAEGKFYEVAAGNPSGVYSIPKADSPDRTAAAIDFLQYLTSPDVQQEIAEKLYQVPILKKANFPDNIKNFLIINEPFKMNLFGPAFSVKMYDTWGSDGPLYLNGSETLEQFSQKMNEAARSEAESLKKSQGWNAANNYGVSK